jgi:hypothetical protein
MNCFEKVSQRLEEWAIRVRGARGEVIADITTDTIKDLCGERYFALPNKFKSYIDDYKRREGTLQSIADYRDHFVHPFHVFWLGYYILDLWREKKKIPLNLPKKGDENLNLKTWFVTSIYHDVGYPAEKLEVLVRDFFKTSVGREMSSQFDWSSVLLANDNIKHIDRLSELFAQKAGGKNQTENFEKWFHKRLLEEHDHGVLTAPMLCSQGWKENDLNEMVYEAALAIALHSWKRTPSEPLEFDLRPLAIEDFPLAFYLSYCDSAQEWGRRVLLELMKIESVPFEIVKIDSRLEDIQADLSETKVILRYLAKKEDLVTDSKTLKQVFDDVGKKFESTWYLKKQSTTKFMIEGKDKDGFGIGGFGARPQ